MKAESLYDWASKTRTVGPHPHFHPKYDEITIVGTLAPNALLDSFYRHQAINHPDGWRSYVAQHLTVLRKCLHVARENSGFVQPRSLNPSPMLSTPSTKP